MTARYTETALAEIEEICSYIAKDNERAAADVATAIERTVGQLQSDRSRHLSFTRGRIHAKLVEKINTASFTRS